MDGRRLQYYRELLNEQLEALVNEAGRTVNHITGQQGAFADPRDLATVERDRNFLLRIRYLERKLILKIREALDSIDEGTYGICEECGEEISEQRLMARPFTGLCMDCRRSQEENERRGGDRRVEGSLKPDSFDKD